MRFHTVNPHKQHLTTRAIGNKALLHIIAPASSIGSFAIAHGYLNAWAAIKNKSTH